MIVNVTDLRSGAAAIPLIEKRESSLAFLRRIPSFFMFPAFLSSVIPPKGGIQLNATFDFFKRRFERKGSCFQLDPGLRRDDGLIRETPLPQNRRKECVRLRGRLSIPYTRWSGALGLWVLLLFVCDTFWADPLPFSLISSPASLLALLPVLAMLTFAAIATALLFAYLFVALLKPELFP